MPQTAIKPIQKDWISAFKENENQTLREIYQKYRADFLRILPSKHSITTEEAKEIFQLSVIVLYENVMTGKLTKLQGNLKSYLLGISSNKVFELYRAHKKELRSKQAYSDMISQIVFESYHQESDLYQHKVKVIQAALMTIGDPCRSILRMFYFNKMTMAEITDYFGYKNESTTKNIKYKCIQRIKKIIANEK